MDRSIRSTVAAFVATVKELEDPSLTPAGRAIAQSNLQELASILDALGLFDVFAVRSPYVAKIVERATLHYA